MVNGILLGLVQSILGKGHIASKGNYAFHCCLLYTSDAADDEVQV